MSTDPNLEQLRAKAARVDELERANLEKDKRLAFLESGLGIPEKGPAKLIFDTYRPGEDEPITAASVLAYAEQYGVTPESLRPVEAATQEEPTVEADKTDARRAEQADRNAAAAEHFSAAQRAASGTESTPGSGNAYVDAYKEFEDEMQQGATREKAAGVGFGAILAQAREGNQSVVYDRDRWHSERA